MSGTSAEYSLPPAALISSDENNIIEQGSDGKLYTSSDNELVLMARIPRTGFTIPVGTSNLPLSVMYIDPRYVIDPLNELRAATEIQNVWHRIEYTITRMFVFPEGIGLDFHVSRYGGSETLTLTGEDPVSLVGYATLIDLTGNTIFAKPALTVTNNSGAAIDVPGNTNRNQYPMSLSVVRMKT